MASPSTSPPAPSSLALSGQRPILSLPNLSTILRKPSTASATPSSHPLRQTSFPPADSLEAQHARAAQYSPTESNLDFSDSELNSAINGPSSSLNDDELGDMRLVGPSGSAVNKKRKRHGVRGRPKKNVRAGSLRNGSSTGRTARAATAGESIISGGGGGGGGVGGAEGDQAAGDPASDSDDAAMVLPSGTRAVYEGAQMGAAEREADKSRRAALYDTLAARGDAERRRYELFHSAKLRRDTVRRLVNQTLSQSVPASVITTIEAYAKLFTGELVEAAREVQGEWYVAAAGLEGGDGAVHVQIEECERGPLTPHHLREALRRYKTRRAGGTVGFTGLSLEGREGAAARMGGSRLFR